MKLNLAALCISLAIGISPAFAALPTTITYQGYLATSGGTAVNTTVSMTLSLYSAASGGSALWTETHSGSVTVSKGVYSVLMGSVTPFPAGLTFDVPYYLGVSVNGEAEMTPRQPLASVPTVFRAMSADKINYACADGEILKYTAASSTWGCAAAAGGGTVTSVSGMSPISVATGTSTPVVSLSGTVPVGNGGTGATDAATARTNLGLGSAATLTAGTAANNLVQLNGSALLPAVDGSQLTNVVASGLGSFATANTKGGTTALGGNTTGTSNTAFGFEALKVNAASSYNSAFGAGALASWLSTNVSADRGNNAFGYQALSSATTGTGNTAFGNQSLLSNQTGTWNTAVGDTALRGATGGSNTGVGSNAGGSLTTGSGNTVVGYNAFSQMAGTGANNVAVGRVALMYGSGSSNVAVGSSSIGSTNNLSGSQNLAVGSNTGNWLTGASTNNVLLGNSADVHTTTATVATNRIAIGAGAIATLDNQAVLGGDGTTANMPALVEVIPGKDATASLGSATKRWTGLYLSAPLAVSQGGSGAATLAANNVLLGNGTSAFQAIAPGTSGNVLTSNGTTWASTAPSGLPAQTGNTNKVLTTDGTSATWNSLTIANGGTGTTNGSITGTSALIFRAGGTGQNVTITPSGSGYTLLNGNVGIGTQWPASKLSVVGDSANGGASFMSYFNSDGTLLRLGRFRGTYAAPTGLLSGDLIGSIVGDAGVNDMFSTMNTSIDFYAEENYSSSAAGSRITFSTTNNATTSLTEKMRITNAGNVGIGTTTPNHKLEVNGTFAALAAINPQTAGYTLAATDNNKFITMDSTGAMTLTLPLNASVAIPVGFQCTVAQKNTGTVTISSSATMITTASTKAFKAKGSAATIIKTGTDEWMLFGDMN